MLCNWQSRLLLIWCVTDYCMGLVNCLTYLNILYVFPCGNYISINWSHGLFLLLLLIRILGLYTVYFLLIILSKNPFELNLFMNNIQIIPFVITVHVYIEHNTSLQDTNSVQVYVLFMYLGLIVLSNSNLTVCHSCTI